MRSCSRLALVIVGLACGADWGSRAAGSGLAGVDIIALTGDPAPDGNGVFSTFDVPALNAAGQVAFRGSLTGTSEGDLDDEGVFFSGGASPVVQLAREGQVSPNGADRFGVSSSSIFGFPVLNASGQVAFPASLEFGSGRLRDNDAIFLGDGTSSLVQIARNGQATPDGDSIVSVSRGSLALNDAGQVAFGASFNGAGGAGQGIYLGDGSSPQKEVVRRGQPAPDGNGSFRSMSQITLNDSGRIAFGGTVEGTRSGREEGGIFFAGGDAPVVQGPRQGLISPEGVEFGGSRITEINGSGEVAFLGQLSGLTSVNGNTFRGSAVYRGDGIAPAVEIARPTQTSPDGSGIIGGFSGSLIRGFTSYQTLNEAGQTAFTGIVSELQFGDSGPAIADWLAIFLGDGVDPLRLIVREGQATPAGDGRFVNLVGLPDLNEAGQVAFLADVIGTQGGGTRSIYVGDGVSPLTEIVSFGDPLLGSTITDLLFGPFRVRGGGYQVRNSGFNDTGQLAFRFSLADGRSGIAIANLIPEPASGGLLVIATMGWASRRRFLSEASLR